VLAGADARKGRFYQHSCLTNSTAPAPILARNLASKQKMTSRLDINPEQSYSSLESQLYMSPSITNRIKELRTSRGWTQEQLAHAVGVSRQSINSIERNRYVPSLELALTFARIFACSTDHIFQLENEK
jgi:putative transcriptional regulator